MKLYVLSSICANKSYYHGRCSSAVDSHIAEHLVQSCLRGPLMRQRTVVLATHHVDLVLPAANWVVKLDHGRIEAQGTVEKLRELGLLSSACGKEEAAVEEEPTIEGAGVLGKKRPLGSWWKRRTD